MRTQAFAANGRSSDRCGQAGGRHAGRSPRVIALVFLVRFALPSVGHASEPADVLARTLFERGQAAYAAARYEEALADYVEAHRARALPGFLFNIAQCHRLLGHGDQAIRFYRSYLAQLPSARNRDVVESLIAEIEETQHRAQTQATSQQPPAHQPEPPARSTATAPLSSATTGASTPPALPIVPSDRELQRAATTSAASPGLEPLVNRSAPRVPIARRWALWVGVGAAVVAVAAVGIGAGLALTHGGVPQGNLSTVDAR